MDEKNYEVISAITSDIQGFLLDMGADPGSYEYDYNAKGSRIYEADIRFITEDADEFIEELADSLYELQEHLRITYPDTAVTFSMSSPDADYVWEEADEDEDDELSSDAFEDDSDAEELDDADKQYEEEGLRIFHEDDDDADFIEEEDEDEGEDLEESFRGSCEDDEDSDFFEEEDEDDEYVPSDEDKEELWKMFGGDYDE